MKKYNSLDLYKLFASICVIAIHTNPLNGCDSPFTDIFKAVTSTAVPFFFLTSGFLLGKKMVYPYNGISNLFVIKKYLLKIFKWYIIWSALYMPLAVHDYIRSGDSVIKCIFLYLRGLLLLGQNYNSWMLWYLLSTIYALIFIYVLLKKKIMLKNIVLISVGIYMISISMDWLVLQKTLPDFFMLLARVIKKTFLTGGLFKGAFYISVGLLLASENIEKWKYKGAWLLLAVGFTAKCMLTNVLAESLVIPVYVIALFIILVQIDMKDSPWYLIARNISMIVYFIHMYVWTLYYSLVYKQKTYGLDCFLVTAMVSLLVAAVYLYIRSNKQIIKTKVQQ